MFLVVAALLLISACLYRLFPENLETTPDFELTVLDDSFSHEKFDGSDEEEIDLKQLNS
jgi:hypothetical protein